MKQFLAQENNQRKINMIISIIILIYIVLNINYVNRASGINIHHKFYVIKFVFIVYTLQAIFNKLWLNSLLVLFYFWLIAYVIYSFVYSFYDPYDWFMNQDNGVVRNMLATMMKLIVILFSLVSTNWSKPRSNFIFH